MGRYKRIKQQARVVVIGGGNAGVSILYHLGRYAHYLGVDKTGSDNSFAAEILSQRYRTVMIPDSP